MTALMADVSGKRVFIASEWPEAHGMAASLGVSQPSTHRYFIAISASWGIVSFLTRPGNTAEGRR